MEGIFKTRRPTTSALSHKPSSPQHPTSSACMRALYGKRSHRCLVRRKVEPRSGKFGFTVPSPTSVVHSDRPSTVALHVLRQAWLICCLLSWFANEVSHQSLLGGRFPQTSTFEPKHSNRAVSQRKKNTVVVMRRCAAFSSGPSIVSRCSVNL